MSINGISELDRACSCFWSVFEEDVAHFTLSVVLRSTLLAIASLLLWMDQVQGAEEKDFTPWMSLSELNAYVEGLDGEKPEGKNFWDRGNWITGVEGRWSDGIPQYRISHSPVPPRRAHWWFWFFNIDQKGFDEKVHALADDGYTLVHYNSYSRPGGGVRYQGVWHKLVPVSDDPPLPDGEYLLTELQGQTFNGTPVTMTIEGTGIVGRGPGFTYTGSVRDRFTGSITEKVEAQDGVTPRIDMDLKRRLLKALEYATWKEEGGRLRAVKSGKTVLRFEREDVVLEAR